MFSPQLKCSMYSFFICGIHAKKRVLTGKMRGQKYKKENMQENNAGNIKKRIHE